MSKILVTGGAGYIGAQTIVELLAAGHEVVSVDNYINSDPITYKLIEELTGTAISYFEGDLCNKDFVQEVFKTHRDLQGVIHFAALKSVPDSVANPTFCLHNNNESLVNITDACITFGVKNILFSSSCSVYGNVTPSMLPVTENIALGKAESPYAYSKQNGERLLEFSSAIAPLDVVALRYFNPVGAHKSGKLGELPSKRVNNLVPVITQAAAGIIDAFTVFGDDWDTRDGSCIRDYIHVTDIARAHVMGIEQQLERADKNLFDIINLGSGEGVSVFEAITAFEQTTSVKAHYNVGPRRDGDVESIFSNPQKAKQVLGWEPAFTINEMMSTAWDWQNYMAELGIAKPH